MGAQLLGEPIFTARDRNGLPINGATAFFYYTGTSTEAPVYADGELATPLEQPVESDSAGRFPSIYLDDSITYRLRLFDEDDVEIEPSPIDPITTLSSQIASAVADAVGDGVGNPFTQQVRWPAPACEDSDIIHAVRFDRAVNFPNNFAGHQFTVETNPDSTTAFDILNNGASIGTMSISSGGVFAFTTTTTPNFVAGDKWKIVAPADPNGVSGIYGSLPGTLA